MIKVSYTEPDGPMGPGCSLEASGHAGYAPAGQDIVCAGASTLMQALVSLMAGRENSRSSAWDEPDGPRLAVTAARPFDPEVEGAFALAKAGFCLLAERYPGYLQFEDRSRSGQNAMMDLQLFAEDGDGGEAAPPAEAPALSRAQAQQAAAAGTLKPVEASPAPAPQPEKPEAKPADADSSPAPRAPVPAMSPAAQGIVENLHARWAAEEAEMRRTQPGFSLQNELKNPEMRRLMQLPGMRVQDAHRLAHYDEELRRTAQAVEQGVVERIRQRAARPAENGVRPGSAAVLHPDVSRMTRAQREELERRAMHGVQIEL